MERILINRFVIFLGVIASLGIGCNRSDGRKLNLQDMAAATVKIIGDRAGGTGTILTSNSEYSSILTNRHICQVLRNGGKVFKDDGSVYAVHSFRESQIHDLCLVIVASDLGIYTRVAERAPSPYEMAAISGHPYLYPSVITSGHFSGKLVIQLVVGRIPCKENEVTVDNLLLCLTGGLAVVKSYEAQLVSATIMSGSSGSAIYNSSGELTDVVFAGTEGLSYALAVPYEYVRRFLDVELLTVPEQRPADTKIYGLSTDSNNE